MKKKKLLNGPAEWKRTLKKLRGVDELFEVLEQDKRLPTFGEFFIVCLVTGNSESVNLRTMFPKLHADLSAWLANNVI